jgi:hypothetical protein
MKQRVSGTTRELAGSGRWPVAGGKGQGAEISDQWKVARGNTKSGNDANFVNYHELLTQKYQPRMNTDQRKREEELQTCQTDKLTC